MLTNANGSGGTPQWINLAPAGGPPSARANHSAVYDAANNRMVIYGGCLGGCLPVAGDVWILTNANGISGTPTWSSLATSGTPPGRQNHRAAYDAANNRMIVFGGQDGGGSTTTIFLQTWVLTNANGLGGTATWTQLSPSGGPPPAEYVSNVVYDAANNRLIVFAGIDTAGGLSNAAWVLSNANGLGGTPVWTNLSAQGAAGSPSVRQAGAAVYSAATNTMTVYGGSGSTAWLTDVWQLSGANGLGGTATWSQIAMSGASPGPIALDAVSHDAAYNRMMVVSQSAGGTALEAWVLSLPGGSGWQSRANLPAARSDAAAVATNGKLYVMGGFGSANEDEMWSYDPATNAWTALATLPGPRYQGTGAAVINGKIYLPGGWTQSPPLPNSNLWVYDPATNTWDTSKASMPRLSACGASAAIGGLLYVLTPCNGYSGYYNFLDAYDPATNAWSSRTSSGTAHANGAFGVINGKLYVAGGINGAGSVHGVLEVYDPVTNAWSTLAAMPTARANTTGAVLGGRLVVAGGNAGAGLTGAVEIYDPATNTWTTGPAMSAPRQSMAYGVISVNEVAYFVGGHNGATQVATVEAFTLSSAPAWQSRASLPGARREAAAAVYNSKLYVMGGIVGGGTLLNETLSYDPSTNAWTTLAPMPAIRAQGDGAAVVNGKIYVVGGWTHIPPLPNNNTWEYDPVANTWTVKANMPILSACGATAGIGNYLYVMTPCDGYSGYRTFLHRFDPAGNSWTQLASSAVSHSNGAFGVINGKLYIAGGVNDSGPGINVLEVYDPASNTWTTLAPMPTARYGATGAVLGGKLVIAGGFNTSGVIIGVVEVYDPATNTWSTSTPMITPRASAAAGSINEVAYFAGGNLGAVDSAIVEAFTLSGGVPGDTQAPGVPTGLTATAISSSQINLSWTASTDNVGVTLYQVYRGGVFRATVNSPTLIFSDTGLAASTLYSYTVMACDAANNCSGPSSSASATTQAAAGSATLLHRYTFSSDVSDSVGTANGTLFNGASASGGVLNFGPTSGYVEFGQHLVPVSGSYSVAFFARLNSLAGNYAEFISQGASGGPGFYIGHDPSHNIRVTDSWMSTGVPVPSDGQLHHYAVVVDALANSTVLYIDAVARASLGSAISTTSAGMHTRLGRQFDPFAEFVPGSLSDVRIYGGALTAGEVAGLAQGGADTQPPTVPTGLTAMAASSSQINLAWSASTDNVGMAAYQVYRGGVFLATVSSPALNFSDTSLAASTLYSYTVAACDAAANCSAQSGSASATTNAAAPPGLTLWVRGDNNGANASFSVRQGQTKQLQAVLVQADGTIVEGVNATWSITAGPATVNGSGVVTGGAVATNTLATLQAQFSDGVLTGGATVTSFSMLTIQASQDNWTGGGGPAQGGDVRGFAVAGTTMLVPIYGGGIYRSTDGANWRQSAYGLPFRSSARMRTLITLPGSSTTLLAGVEGSGIYRSADGGATWTPSNSGTNCNFPTRFSAASATTVYVATSCGAVYVSFDNGVTWSATGVIGGNVIGVQAAGSTVWAWTLGNGIYRSTDGGASWEPTNTGVPNPNVYSVNAQPNLILAMVEGAGIFRSSDGNSWVAQNSGLPASYGFQGSIGFTGGYFYVSVEGYGIFRGTTGANAANPVTWTAWGNTATQLPKRSFTPGIFNGLYYVTGGQGVYRSSDDGASWQAVKAGLPSGFVTNTVTDPGNTNVVYAAADTIYKSLDGAATWIQADSGITAAVSFGNRGGGQLVRAVDGALYASTANAGIFKSADGAASWTPANNGLPALIGRGVTPRTHPSDPQKLFALYSQDPSGLYRSTNGGASWSSMSGDLSGNGLYVAAIALDEATGHYYIGTRAGVYKSVNNGVNWTPVYSGFGVNFVRIDSGTNPATVYWSVFVSDAFSVPLAGSGIYKSVDGGATYTQILSDRLVFNFRVLRPAGPRELYAASWNLNATESGVLKSVDGGTTWQTINAGLNHAFVSGFDPVGEQLLHVSSRGRGVYNFITSTSPPAVPTSVSATVPAGTSNIQMSWSPVAGATGYNIYMAMAPGVTKANHLSLASGHSHLNVTSPYTHPSAAAGTHYFVVTALNANGESIESAQVSTNIVTLNVSSVYGIVTGTGINCGADCTENYGSGASVTLSATSSAGYVFGSWTGCDSPSGASCTMTMNATKSVTANFAPVVPVSANLSVSVSGGGAVTSNPAGISCPGDCTEGYTIGTPVTLSATPGAGNAFTGWSGDCTGTGACMVTMSAARTVNATFAAVTPIALATGFNLVGNSITAALNVVGVFGNQDPGNPIAGVTDKVLSLWSWNATTQKWRFYSPQLAAAQNAAYAASNNFELLSSVPAGEGYWINASQAFTLNAPGGTPFNHGLVSFGARPPSWNLLVMGSTLTVQQFNCNLGSPPGPGQACPANFESLWAYDAIQGKWFFYSPQLEQSGAAVTNCQYAASHGLLCFDTPGKLLGPAVGFFVRKLGDYVPGAIVFAGASALPGALVTSQAVTVSGFEGVLYPRVAGGQLLKNGLAYGGPMDTWSATGAYEPPPAAGAPEGIRAGDQISLQLTMPAAPASASVTLGGVTGTFSVALAPATLSVNVGGSGSVTSNPAGINCGATCSAQFTYGSSVTLTPTPGAGYVFSGWSGACTGTGSCVVTADAAKSVTATFTLQTFVLTVVNSGNGTVTSSPAGINCGVDCTETYVSGTSVTLTPASNTGYVFSGWSGDCTGSGACTVIMSAVRTVSASFALATVPLVLQNGFNLVGNSTTTALNVASVFGNVVDNVVAGVSDKVDAVWRWNAATQKWQFYTPQLTAAASAAYATSHNYEVLSSIPAGEGYWISTYGAFTLNVASGIGFNYGLISFGARPRFWNLLSIGSNLTVQEFNCNMGAPPSPGQPCAANFESLWAWKATSPQKWYFYSPQLDGGVPFTNCTYAANNGYLCFDTSGKTLGLGVGFWVYKP